MRMHGAVILARVQTVCGRHYRMRAMGGSVFKYSGLVFLGGVGYGIMATITKTGLAAGFDWTELVASQAFCGATLFLAVFAVSLVRGKRPFKPTKRELASMLLLGACSFSVSVLYNAALPGMSAAVATTFLFQYTWMGIVVQVIATRRPPNRFEVASAVTIVIGMLLVSGVVGEVPEGVEPWSVTLCLLAALVMAVYMYLSARVAVGREPVERGMFVCFGACVLAFAVCPTFFTGGALQEGVWHYGLFLGAAGLVIPVILFGIGTPHISTGLATIMASSELPTGVIVSMLVLGEDITLLQAAGVVIILCGVVISQVPNFLISRGLKVPR